MDINYNNDDEEAKQKKTGLPPDDSMKQEWMNE